MSVSSSPNSWELKLQSELQCQAITIHLKSIHLANFTSETSVGALEVIFDIPCESKGVGAIVPGLYKANAGSLIKICIMSLLISTA